VAAEIDLIDLDAEEWQSLREAAAELDLVRGGYFRLRPDAILFYAGPENAPDGWPGSFEEGSPDLPRAAVGAAEVYSREGENRLTVRLLVSNWSAARAVHNAGAGSDYREFVLAQEAALRGTPEDRAWLRRQFERLCTHAGGGLLEDA